MRPPSDQHQHKAELRRLKVKLAYLANAWHRVELDRGFQAAIVAEYRHTLVQMFDLGWRGSLKSKSRLPDELMPDFYLKYQAKQLETIRGCWIITLLLIYLMIMIMVSSWGMRLY